MQKTEFLKALSNMWKDFDGRVLRYKVICSTVNIGLLMCCIGLRFSLTNIYPEEANYLLVFFAVYLNICYCQNLHL
jgi:hypothetical protein